MSELLSVLNRPSKKKEQEKANDMREKKRGPWIVRNIKWVMFGFFNTVAFVFDALAVTTVYQLTNGSVLLSALSVLPTGVPMLMWEGGWLYPLADAKQKNKSLWGIALSIFSALVVGGCAILATLGTADFQFWVSAFMLIWCVVVVIVHGILAAMYFYKDPVIQRDHELQVTIAENTHQSETLRETETLLADVEKMLNREKELKDRFGESEVNRALELLLGLDLNGDGKIGGRHVANKPANAFASETKTVKPENPTNPPSK